MAHADSSMIFVAGGGLIWTEGIHMEIIRSNVAYNLYLDMVLVLAAGYKTVQIKCKKLFPLNINEIQVSKKIDV